MRYEIETEVRQYAINARRRLEAYDQTVRKATLGYVEWKFTDDQGKPAVMQVTPRILFACAQVANGKLNETGVRTESVTR